MKELDKTYWELRYMEQDTPWDVGRVSAPMRHIIDRLGNTDLRILLPGAGSGWEAGYLMESGYHAFSVLDWSAAAMERLRVAFPDIPFGNLVVDDFFRHEGTYDVILEQTFFCALDPGMRKAYAKQMHRLLAPGGVLTGVLFSFPLTQEGPPFGGSAEEYRSLLSPYFHIETIEPCVFSELPRMGREVYIRAVKRD